MTQALYAHMNNKIKQKQQQQQKTKQNKTKKKKLPGSLALQCADRHCWIIEPSLTEQSNKSIHSIGSVLDSPD
jgi:hypothetical protein